MMRYIGIVILNFLRRAFKVTWDIFIWVVERIFLNDIFLFLFTLFAVFILGYYLYAIWGVLM
jgi:hypothetical protein